MNIPIEIVQHVTNYLPVESLMAFASTCTVLHRTLRADLYIWKHRLLSIALPHQPPPTPPSFDAYRHQHMIQSRWKSGIDSARKTLLNTSSELDPFTSTTRLGYVPVCFTRAHMVTFIGPNTVGLYSMGRLDVCERQLNVLDYEPDEKEPDTTIHARQLVSDGVSNAFCVIYNRPLPSQDGTRRPRVQLWRVDKQEPVMVQLPPGFIFYATLISTDEAHYVFCNVANDEGRHAYVARCSTTRGQVVMVAERLVPSFGYAGALTTVHNTPPSTPQICLYGMQNMRFEWIRVGWHAVDDEAHYDVLEHGVFQMLVPFHLNVYSVYADTRGVFAYGTGMMNSAIGITSERGVVIHWPTTLTSDVAKTCTPQCQRPDTSWEDLDVPLAALYHGLWNGEAAMSIYPAYDLDTLFIGITKRNQQQVDWDAEIVAVALKLVQTDPEWKKITMYHTYELKTKLQVFPSVLGTGDMTRVSKDCLLVASADEQSIACVDLRTNTIRWSESCGEWWQVHRDRYLLSTSLTHGCCIWDFYKTNKTH